MKTKLPIIAVVAILVSACTTGTYMTKNYDDGIYFTPADQPPVTIASGETNAPVKEKSAIVGAPNSSDQSIVMSQMSKNPDGTSTVNNYIYQPDKDHQNSDVHAYNMDNQELENSDTTALYNDDSIKYVINNYYDDNDDIDYAYRIGRFYRPFYNPFFYDDWNYGFYSPWYSGYYGFNWGIGWDPWYYGGWGYPYYYGGYYSPYYLGFNGYWGMGYPYWGGYYGGYYGGGYYGGGGHFAETHQVARRRTTNMNLQGNGTDGGLSVFGRSANLKNGTSDQNKISNTWVENGHVRGRSIDGSANSVTKSATIVNDRRSSINSGRIRGNNIAGNEENQVTRSTQMIRQGTNASGNVRRSYAPTTTSRTYTQGRVSSQDQNYMPSYSKPRIVNQSNYNNNTYTRPRTYSNSATESVRSANTGRTQIYNAPRSSSSVRQTYRSSSSYSPGSSSSSYRSSSSSGYSSGSTYSAPARSSSSYSSGGSYSGGGGSSSSGGGSVGGGGGGSGHRR